MSNTPTTHPAPKRPKSPRKTASKEIRQVTKSIHFDVAILAALDKAAKAEHRKRSPMANILLRRVLFPKG